MLTINLKTLLKWVAVIAWAVVIFMFSAQSGEQSGGLSTRVVEMVVMPVLNFIGLADADFSIISFLVRKAAHMFIYFVLSIFTVSAVLDTYSFKKAITGYAIALVVCFVYAISDEFHQSFSPGRAMAFTDVIIDTAGAFLGLCLYALISFLRKKIN